MKDILELAVQSKVVSFAAAEKLPIMNWLLNQAGDCVHQPKTTASDPSLSVFRDPT